MQYIALVCFVVYTIVLFVVMWITSRKSNNESFYIGNRQSPWFVVAYGMIGASLSGVTFLSVPGDVYKTQFTYFGIVLGYLIGYFVIAKVLLPVYYKLNLTSIYTYLEQRFGFFSYKTGSFFFILSRILGSALRMYLMIYILQEFIFNQWGIPVWITATIFILIIYLYTFKGGIKTVVWTDLFQTTFMILALILTMFFIVKSFDMSFLNVWDTMKESGYTKVFNTNWRDSNFFVKQIISGAFITITMTGLDQDMMQKNLSCKTLKDSQKNMFTFSGILVVVNALFLLLGGMLCVYATSKGIDLESMKTDRIFPTVAINYLPAIAGVVFMIGLIAAGYSSADGTLTALTTVVCYDLIGLEKKEITKEQKVKIRRLVHIGISFLFLILIIIFSKHHDDALIRIVFNVASYTYGPLLGLYAFGLFTKRKLKKDFLVPVIAVLSPILCFFLNKYSKTLFWGYEFGFELLLVNGFITFVGLFLLSYFSAPKSTTVKV